MVGSNEYWGVLDGLSFSFSNDVVVEYFLHVEGGSSEHVHKIVPLMLQSTTINLVNHHRSSTRLFRIQSFPSTFESNQCVTTQTSVIIAIDHLMSWFRALLELGLTASILYHLARLLYQRGPP